ncbi:hypothetical protein HanXRQr2_Chr04g0186311 [Helianthus annuus]|uniref:Uncharacterized protein n=1 Tax=Helianthus annuus TaxID=4232 RepID=A0A251V1S8_HELAN|nr:hypothetical protein HanXRQr2_Chr04g0186311 [Helianthus annuus]
MVIWMENNLWEFVARECGLKVGLLASLKLTHIKYLKELDQWLLNEGFNDEKMENLEVFTAKRSENEQKSGMAEGWHGNRGSRELKRRKFAVLEFPGGPRRLNSQLHAPRIDLKEELQE